MGLIRLLAMLVALAFPLAAAEQTDPPAVEGSVVDRAADTAPNSPHFQEILRILRANLAGVTEAELNQAMVTGLLDEFSPRVELVSANPSSTELASEPRLRRVAVYAPEIAYLGVRRVEPGLASEVASALDSLGRTNALLGVVLDLRAAMGWNYDAAAEVAGAFAEPERLLMGWGDSERRAGGSPGFDGPVVVLVNRETAGAAEALAGALHDAGPAVLLGAPTAGRAHTMQSFPLENGKILRVAGAPVWVGDHRPLEGPIQPDLAAPDQPELDRRWLENPFYAPPGTNVAIAANRPRMDEAELVRQHRGLTNQLGLPRTTPSPSDAGPALQDPGLSGALAVLQGLMRIRGGIRR